MQRTFTWPEIVRYLALMLTALALILPMAISGSFPTIPGPSRFEWPGGRPCPPSKALAVFWCLSLLGFLFSIATWWRVGGASVIVFFVGFTVFGIAHLLTILSPDFGTPRPKRSADSSPAGG